MAQKVTSYKGFKIQEQKDTFTEYLLYVVYTKDEWVYGKNFRSPEWEACSMKEATDFIDSWDEGQPVTADNYSRYDEGIGFVLLST